MNGWQLTFSECFDYSRFNDIVLPLKLSSDKANQILLRAKVDTGSTFLINLLKTSTGDLRETVSRILESFDTPEASSAIKRLRKR